MAASALKDEDIITEAIKRFQEHLDACQYWRNYELSESYMMCAGGGENAQWKQDEYDEVISNGLKPYTINKASPVLDAIAGFEIQNRGEAKYYPRLNNVLQEGFTDVVSNTVQWIQQDSGCESENSQAFKDCLLCGVGYTNTYIDYSENHDGDVIVRRGFPGFLMYDPAARRKNMRDANWLAEAKVTPVKEVMAEYDIAEAEARSSSFNDSEFLNYFDLLQTRSDLTVVYEYQWRVRQPFYRMKNPFQEHADNPLVMNYMTEAMKAFGIDPADQIFNMSIKNGKALMDGLEAIGVQFEQPLRQKRYCYYRAIIAGGAVREKSENYSQKGFSIKVMTGKFDEINQCYYGVMRPIKPTQRLLNQAVTDYQGFLSTIPKGGVNIELDAVPDIKAFKDTFALAKDVTVFNPGALANNKVLPKVAPNMPQGLPEMIAYANNACMEVVGVTPDFMGIVDTKEMTSALYSQKVRQGLTVLADYFDAKRFYTIDQGKLFIDCSRVLAENSPGRLIRNVTGEGSEKYFPLFKDNIASEYDVIVEEAAATPNERAELFKTLTEIGVSLLNKPNPVDIMPMAIQFAPLSQEKIDELEEMMKPPPAPPPDPRPGQLLESEAALNMANAGKAEAEAMQKRIDTLAKFKEIQDGLPVDPPDPMAELDAELKREELRLKHRELNVKTLEILQKNKAIGSKERVDLAKIQSSDRKLEDDALQRIEDDTNSDADEEMKRTEENDKREEEVKTQRSDLEAREAALEARMAQMSKILEAMKDKDNAEIVTAVKEMAKATSTLTQAQAQATKAQTQMLAMLKNIGQEVAKDDAPKAVVYDVNRDSKGNLTSVVKREV